METKSEIIWDRGRALYKSHLFFRDPRVSCAAVRPVAGDGGVPRRKARFRRKDLDSATNR